MKYASSRVWMRIKDGMAQVVLGPPILAFLPALTLATFWLGGEIALLILAIGLPLLCAWFGLFSQNTLSSIATRRGFGAEASGRLGGALDLSAFEAQVQSTFEKTDGTGLKSAMLVIEVDDFDELVETHGLEAGDTVLERCSDRIVSTLRQRDIVAMVDRSRFAVCISPVLQLDLESALQMAGRLQSTLEDPISVDGTSVFVSSSIGLCLRNRAPGSSANDWCDAAVAALEEARAVSPAGIRVYSRESISDPRAAGNVLSEAADALRNGQIEAWFQPQVNTDTGRVSGFEALARWSHPAKGMIPPSVFLPALEQNGLLAKLSNHMIEQALTALTAWDAAGLDVPCVGVNFATDELRDPGLVDRIRWDLERFGLTPDRLSVEILETVMTDAPDDMVARNITALGEMGCRIDLDDFGTGHASIASVRRFRVSRIKIDRSFVTKADHDPEQQKLIAAILTMAERLELDTLAEGVETVGEHALLSQLGCGHVQGFGIGRPMPFDQTLDWVVAHEAKLQDAPEIGTQRR